MSQKDYLRGARDVGNAAGDKLKEMGGKIGGIRNDFKEFTEQQNTINEGIINNVDQLNADVQALKDNRDFVRISRHSLEDMEPHELEQLAAWLQKLMLEMKNRGFDPSANQQEFLSNFFKLTGLRDILIEQHGGLEVLGKFGDSAIHEVVYKIFLTLCYLHHNSFDILDQFQDVDQMFKLGVTEKQKLRELLENERIPALGVAGLVGMLDPGRPLNSFTVESLFSSHTAISAHPLQTLGLSKADYAVYVRSFALLVPQSRHFSEKQRDFLSAIATILGCPESVFEVDQLCLTPQNVDVRAWQTLLSDDNRKYAWGLDGAALLALDPTFDPENNKVLEQALKNIRVADAREFIAAVIQMTRETEPTKLYETIKEVNRRSNGWKHIVEYCGCSLKDAFAKLRNNLYSYSTNISLLSIECATQSMKTMDYHWEAGSFDGDGFLSKMASKAGEKFVATGRWVSLSNLRDLKKKAEQIFEDNAEVRREANDVLNVFGFESIGRWSLELDEFDLDNSGSNEAWGDGYDHLNDRLQKAIDGAAESARLLAEQLALFEKGNLYESVIIKKQQKQIAQEEQRQAEIKAKLSAKLSADDKEQLISIAWTDVPTPPFDPSEISSIASDGKGWGMLVGGERLYYSTDAIAWVEASNPTSSTYCSFFKCINGMWLLGNSDELFFSNDGQSWQKSSLPSRGCTSFDIFFFDGQWLLLMERYVDYSYTKKGLIFDSTETSNYRTPIFYRGQSLQGNWEKWDEASRLGDGIVLKSRFLGISEKTLVASFEYDYSYASNKKRPSREPRVSYISPQGRWKNATWPKEREDSCDGNFYFFGTKGIFWDRDVILTSPNGFEWVMVAKDLFCGDQLLEVGGVLFIPSWLRNIAYISNDGANFSELALSDSPDHRWDKFVTNGKEILATFRPSKHEIFLKKGILEISM